MVIGIFAKECQECDKETQYLKPQRLVRIATVSTQLQPDVAPVGFAFDGQHFYIGGLQQEKTHKYQNVAHGHSQVALVIDDVESVDPWKPRGITIHGKAEIVERQGQFGPAPYLQVRPEKYWSWGIERPVFEAGKVVMHKRAITMPERGP